MTRTTKSLLNFHPKHQKIGEIREHIACSMIGRTVSLIINTSTVANGIVDGVLLEAGIPKVIVNGAQYDLQQVLTSSPVQLNP